MSPKLFFFEKVTSLVWKIHRGANRGQWHWWFCVWSLNGNRWNRRHPDKTQTSSFRWISPEQLLSFPYNTNMDWKFFSSEVLLIGCLSKKSCFFRLLRGPMIFRWGAAWPVPTLRFFAYPPQWRPPCGPDVLVAKSWTAWTIDTESRWKLGKCGIALWERWWWRGSRQIRWVFMGIFIGSFWVEISKDIFFFKVKLAVIEISLRKKTIDYRYHPSLDSKKHQQLKFWHLKTPQFFPRRRPAKRCGRLAKRSAIASGCGAHAPSGCAGLAHLGATKCGVPGETSVGHRETGSRWFLV